MGQVAKLRAVESRGKWKAKALGTWFGAEGDDEYRFSSMMWADNCSIFSDDKEKLTSTAHDIIDELLDLDMEPKGESLWWTSTCKAEAGSDLGGGRQRQELEDAVRGKERMLKRRMGSCWKNSYIYRAKSVSMTTMCERVVRQELSIGLNCSVIWLWSGGRSGKPRF